MLDKLTNKARKVKYKRGFRTLKAPHPRKFYKNDRGYIEAIYRKNKDFIDERMNRGPGRYMVSSKRAFANYIFDYMEIHNLRAPSAVRKFISSEEFTTYKERAAFNIENFIKKDKKTYEKFKKLSGINKKEEFDINRLEYDVNDQLYKYGDIYIDVSNSPYGVHIFKETDF